MPVEGIGLGVELMGNAQKDAGAEQPIGPCGLSAPVGRRRCQPLPDIGPNLRGKRRIKERGLIVVGFQQAQIESGSNALQRRPAMKGFQYFFQPGRIFSDRHPQFEHFAVDPALHLLRQNQV